MWQIRLLNTEVYLIQIQGPGFRRHHITTLNLFMGCKMESNNIIHVYHYLKEMNVQNYKICVTCYLYIKPSIVFTGKNEYLWSIYIISDYYYYI